MRRKRRRTRSQLQCSLQHKCSRVVLVCQGNCFCPVYKEGEENNEEKKEEVEEEEGGGGGGREGDHNSNAVFCSNAAQHIGYRVLHFFSEQARGGGGGGGGGD